MMSTFLVAFLIFYLQIQQYDTACEFAIYNHADTDNAASSNEWEIMYYADFQDTSPYKQSFINYMIANNYRLRAISTWTFTYCAIVYGEGTTTDLFGLSSVSGTYAYPRGIGATSCHWNTI